MSSKYADSDNNEKNDMEGEMGNSDDENSFENDDAYEDDEEEEEEEDDENSLADSMSQ